MTNYASKIILRMPDEEADMIRADLEEIGIKSDAIEHQQPASTEKQTSENTGTKE